MTRKLRERAKRRRMMQDSAHAVNVAVLAGTFDPVEAVRRGLAAMGRAPAPGEAVFDAAARAVNLAPEQLLRALDLIQAGHTPDAAEAMVRGAGCNP